MSLPTVSPKTSFSIVYRSGGVDCCTWTRVGESFATQADAQAWGGEKLHRAGYHFLVFKTTSLDTSGLPIGWEPSPSLFEDFDVRYVFGDQGPLQSIATRKASIDA